MWKKITIAGLFCFVSTQTIYAQVCQRSNTPQTVAVGNFDLLGAEIQDKITGLIWKRCVAGQSWNGTTCDGPPIKLTWQQALKEASQLGSGWRLPDTKELNSILDLQCAAPPFNPVVFPDMPASESNGLWSSTPYINAAPNTNAWWLDLMFGNMDYRSILTTNFAIFVRSP